MVEDIFLRMGQMSRYRNNYTPLQATSRDQRNISFLLFPVWLISRAVNHFIKQ